MQIVSTPAELNLKGRKVCLAIGFFDGVHLGHQQIIRQTIADARQHEALALVVTFDRHPNTVVAPERVPPFIYSLERKLQTIGALGVDAVLLIHFDQAFSEQEGEAFVRHLARDLGHIHSLCVGANFRFGHQRTGDVALLKRVGAELKFQVHGVASVSLDDQTVSSTRIREAIRAGELETASQMLGRPYSLRCKVLHGDELGRTLGFPTANLDVTGLALPPGGVYAAHAVSGSTTYRSVLNIGHRPTVRNPSTELRVEVHLLDFSGDLYDQELKVVFVDKLRDEKKFDSLDQLRDQIARDIREAESRF